MKKLVLLLALASCLQTPVDYDNLVIKDRRDYREYIQYYANGQPLLLGALRNGERHGFWSFWRSTGKLWMEGFFRDDEQVGLWLYWDKGGFVDLKLSGFYKKGVKVNAISDILNGSSWDVKDYMCKKCNNYTDAISHRFYHYEEWLRSKKNEHQTSHKGTQEELRSRMDLVQ